jgi:hypothetical protein
VEFSERKRMAASKDMPKKSSRVPRAQPDQAAAARRRRRQSALWNVLTILMLVGTLAIAVIFLLIYSNPYSALNPFPPPTLPAVVLMPTNTPTPEGMLPATNTPLPEPSATPSQIASPSLLPSDTPLPTTTFALPGITVSPSPTIRPTATPGGYAFVPQEGSPDAIPYSIYSDVGCNYMGVGGRVIGLDGSPVTPGVIVRLRGSLDGRSVAMDTLSGTVTEFGESGFGFQLSDHPIATRGLFYVQLVDQAYLPMSDRIYFDTFDTCDKNLIFITFRQVR